MNRDYRKINFRLLDKQQHHVLTAFLFLAALPHFFNLSLAISLFFFSILLFRLVTRLLSHREHPRWMNYIFLITGLVIVVSEYSGVIGKDFGVSLLVAMLSLKILEIKTYRDAYVLLFLTTFMLITHFLYTQEMFIVFYVFTLTFFMLFLFLWFNQLQQKVSFYHLFLTTGKISLQAIPVMVILFIFFPRLDGPLWGFDQQSGLAVTGISGNISPGSISQLSKSSATAFRVKFDDPDDIPQPELRYWRGPVIVETDGINWKAEEKPLAAEIRYQSAGEPVSYQITTEASNEHWVFALDLPATIPEQTFVTKDYAVRAKDKIQKRTTFNFISYPEYLAHSTTSEQLDAALSLPGGVTDRMRQFVDTMKRSNHSNEDFVRSVLNHFNTENFIYTLSPPPLTVNPADEFLFETRKGFCEHYATSFVLLMRIAGIPARVVAGYQGGEWNTAGNHLIVRQSDAHAWSEIWLGDKGWVRVDPTTAVAPERVERSIDPEQFLEGAPVVFKISSEGMFGSFLKQAVFMADALDLNWHRWVVGFSRERQNYFLRSTGLDFLEGYKLGLSAIVLSSLAIIIMVLIFRGKIIDRRDPAKKLWDKFIHKLNKRGVSCKPADGPQTIARNAGQILTENSSSINLISRMYIQVRYGKMYSPDQLRTLKKLISDF
jgi:transglutaminase-like putative cysteine protease